MQQNSFLLYGANGYTGELIARYAKDYQLQPILAGRTEATIKPLAEKLHLPYKIIDLADASSLQKALREVKVVVHAAGPFKFTAKQMVDACIETGTHYLDINGDIAVFEMLKQYDTKAKRAGIMLLPGVGFDVVPTDCIALQLKNLLPDATSIQLAFATIGGKVSHGTALSMVEKIGEGGAVRKNGIIVRRPLGEKGMWVDFGLKKLFVMSIPWGDISTANFTTGIPDIEAFTGMSPNTYRILKLQATFNWLLRTSFIRNIIKNKIHKLPAGPDDITRAAAKAYVWGKATNASGETAIARLSGPEGYTLTMYSALLITKKVLEGKLKLGYQTPATAYGEDFVLEIPGVKREVVH